MYVIYICCLAKKLVKRYFYQESDQKERWELFMKTRKRMAMAMAGAMALPTCTAFADSAEEPVKLTGLFISHSLKIGRAHV